VDYQSPRSKTTVFPTPPAIEEEAPRPVCKDTTQTRQTEHIRNQITQVLGISKPREMTTDLSSSKKKKKKSEREREREREPLRMLKVIGASQGDRNSENNKIQKVISKPVLILQKQDKDLNLPSRKKKNTN
jgi:hypothetical protein